ncbi:MAG: hemolysin family protein [bacterium]
METFILTGFILLLILFIGSAMFSAAETALISLSRHKLRMLQKEKPHKADYIERWIEDPKHMLTTILIGINFLNITAAIIAEYLISIFVKKWGLPEWAAPAISIGFVSLIVIEFCEIIPKIVAYHDAEKYSMRLIRPLVIAEKILKPLNRGLVGFGNIMIRLFGGKPGSPQGTFVSEAEILSIVERGKRQGVIEKKEGEMIRSIFELGGKQVREVMVPRPDMDTASEDMTVTQLAQVVEEINHSRIPIFKKDVDNITAIVNSNALLKALKEGRDNEQVKNFGTKPHFVPETKMVNELMHEFQVMQIHMAIVVDEYGSVAGLVTLEDLLEEIIGEIRDEYDTEEPLYRWLTDSTLRVNARIDIAELNEILDHDLPDEEGYESLGGLIFHVLGKVPKTGEVLTIDSYELTVEKMTGRRIVQVIIMKIEKTREKQKKHSGENGNRSDIQNEKLNEKANGNGS